MDDNEQSLESLLDYKNITLIDNIVNDRVYMDNLTGAFNRNFYNDYVESLETTALAILDLDNLKSINDTYGHLAGDEALRATAKAVKHAVRSDDIVIRYGGDEFVIIFKNIPKEILRLRLEAIRRNISKIVLADFSGVKLTCSIGATTCVHIGKETIRKADSMLYKAKTIKDNVAIDFGEKDCWHSIITKPIKPSNKRTLLVIEDNDLNREMLTELLAEEYNILEAVNGALGLDLLQKHITEVSVVILDVQMPVMNGYEFLEIVKQDSLLAEIPVIVATSNGDATEESKCLALGANDFVSKPYNFDIIKRRVASIIRLKESVATMSALQIDDRTGIYTFQAFCYYAKQLLEAAQDKAYSVTVFDVNKFKRVNEYYGEETGNKVLKKLAEAIRENTPADGICGRYGAARFLLLHETYSEADTEIMMRELFAKLTAACGVKGMTFKAGIYNNVDSSLSVSLVCDRAIVAMNSIEQGFDSRYAVYDEAHAEKLRYLAELEADMQEAYDEEQFSVYYQPKHAAKTGELVGAEALIRWQHPEKGFLSPGIFIPLFEKNGFISHVDYYVLEHTCKNIKAWQEEGLRVVPVSVNASRRDFDRENYLETIMRPIRESAIDTKFIHLEVTESLFSERMEQMSSVIHKCREAGLKIELDDFGTGYSSLNTLTTLPLDVLKLDMSFMKNYKDERKMKVLHTCIDLAKGLGLKTICEGVENQEQLAMLQEFGCDAIQGYYFSKPLPEAEFREYLRKN